MHPRMGPLGECQIHFTSVPNNTASRTSFPTREIKAQARV